VGTYLAMPYQLLADGVLTLHCVVVAFVVAGLVLVIIGNSCEWRWVNAFGFRLAHLAAILIVVAEVWLGATCPLTTVELSLRAKAGTTTYAGSFVGHWLQRFLYYDAPSWVFVVAYSLFGLLVVATWYRFPPTRRRGVNERDE
jgi:polyferredoxin